MPDHNPETHQCFVVTVTHDHDEQPAIRKDVGGDGGERNVSRHTESGSTGLQTAAD